MRRQRLINQPTHACDFYFSTSIIIDEQLVDYDKESTNSAMVILAHTAYVTC